MANIKQIMLKLAAKSQLYESNIWLPSINEVTKRNLSTRLEIADELLKNPQLSLEVVFRCYAFTRGGGADRANYHRISVKALKNTIGDSTFLEFIEDGNAPEKLWREFEAECRQESVGINEKLNEGVIKGFLTLSQKVRDYSLAAYLKEGIILNLEGTFRRLNEIKGIGPKIACFLLRDFAWLFNLEHEIAHEHEKYLQPIDIWLVRTAECLWPDLKGKGRWVIAERIVEECKEAGISNIEFNQGAWYFCTQETICERLLEL